jgi:8-oxo-dGTP pyrophosphatase MutT (NUDIX family)
VTQNPDCFVRSLQHGHITGSAFVIDPCKKHVLLTHHCKLNQWLQLGGHADGEMNIQAVALREAMEESGLSQIKPLSDSIFDVDIHLIPARKEEPAHYHYDIRFLFEANPEEPLHISNESNDLQWIEFNRITNLNVDQSIMRMVHKITNGCID